MKYLLIVENIAEIFTAEEKEPLITGGNLLITVDTDGKISFAGPRENFLKAVPGFSYDDADLVYDAGGRVVYPGFVDSHTHLVFASTREDEFAMKASGATYEEIAAAGGGILNSTKKTNAASLETIIEQTAARLEQIILYGVTTIEIKSGYALDTEGEIKLLRAVRELKKRYPVEIISTFLGAHAYPEKFKNDHEGYLNLIIGEMLPEIRKENLAEFVDVFCEEGYFSSKETEKIFVAAKEMGFELKLHADEFNSIGGTELAAEMGAVSVDHLEAVTDEGIRRLAAAGTVAGVLPLTSVFSRLPFAPARKMMENGVKVALATDMNPGSCMCGFLPLAASLGATQLKLSVEESLRGITSNAACSVQRETKKGKIAVGMDADLVVMDSCSWIYPVYHFAHNHAHKIFVRGKPLTLKGMIG